MPRDRLAREELLKAAWLAHDRARTRAWEAARFILLAVYAARAHVRRDANVVGVCGGFSSFC